MIPSPPLFLALTHAHVRDPRVSFDEAKHEYTVDGHTVIGSVSSLWGSRFEKFDAEGTARRCYPKWKRNAENGEEANEWNYTERFVRLIEGGDDDAVRRAGVTEEPLQTGKGYSRLLKHLWRKGLDSERCIEAVVDLWSKLGENASIRGTYIHLQCELHCNLELYDEHASEVRQYLCFRKHHSHLSPYRTEWSVFARLGLYVVAGQVDCIYRTEDGDLIMIDYKCCAHELTPKNPFRKFGTYPFQSVPDTPWGHYACQQNIYRYILEKFYGVILKSCKLLRLHSSIQNYQLVEVPDLRHNVQLLFADLEKKTLRSNLKKTLKQRFVSRIKTLLIIVRISIYCKKKHKITMSEEAHSLTDAVQNLNVFVTPADDKKREQSKGKGCVHAIFTKPAGGGQERIALQMPRGMTFGARLSMNNNNSAIPKYQMTLKYRMEQTSVVVDPLREIHALVKQSIVNEFHRILPKTCKSMLVKMHKKDKDIPLDLFEKPEEERNAYPLAEMRDLFMERALEKVDEIFIFGGSEETYDLDAGKSKMISFAPEKNGKDGKTYDKSWMVNVNAPIITKAGKPVFLEVQRSVDSDGGALKKMEKVPNFDFSLHEGPEFDLSSYEEIKKEDVIARFGPTADSPVFSREGVAVITLRYIHVRDDETQISVNMTLEHFHAFSREQSTLGKRKFQIKKDPDTPQEDPIASHEMDEEEEEEEEEDE